LDEIVCCFGRKNFGKRCKKQKQKSGGATQGSGDIGCGTRLKNLEFRVATPQRKKAFGGTETREDKEKETSALVHGRETQKPEKNPKKKKSSRKEKFGMGGKKKNWKKRKVGGSLK